MARHKDDRKQASREAILKRAAERFRREGIAAVGVRPLMADAGLTHGGFYAHFASRDDLVAATLEYASEATLGYFREALATAPEGQKLERLISTYLRPLHREHMGLGCAVSALGPEIARQDPETRQRFDVRRRGLVALLAEHLPEGGQPEARLDRASIVFATMMGTLQLMRIETDPAVVERLVAAGRQAALRLATQPWPAA
ncbi:TetR/AcrR family transcriptional regulator [Phenylobacterium sp.]|jgi:TetR/AcrR family transcriptional repressor of nem operon|uniref:TetR/AcrR family transcriptional regulator n=1 Tax=Phenylobacterium sp. TaxID=1871053 RepID=UPI002F93660B